MKYFLGLTLSILVLNSQKAQAQAQSTIDITTQKHEYSMYTSIIQNIVAGHEQNFNNMLGKELECRLVSIKPNVFKEPGIFSKGIYSLTLSAICNKSFNDLKLSVTYGPDYGNPWAMLLTYVTADGQKHQLKSQDKSSDD